jgi:hydrogenase maturation protease
MGDDGVGVKIVEDLSSRDLGPDVETVCGGTAGIAVAQHFAESDSVVVVDAIATDDVPGSVFRFTPQDVGLHKLRSYTSHGFSLSNILFAASLQGSLPHVIIYAVQIGDITCGFDTLTAEVSAAVPDVCDMVITEALKLAAEEPSQLGEPRSSSHSVM